MKVERGSRSKKMAAFLKERRVERTHGNCPLCHHLILNGTLHAPAACKPRRPQYGNARHVSRETER